MTTPTNLSHIDADAHDALIASGYRAIVYAAWAYGDKEQGDIISRHKTADAAQRKAAGSTFWAVKDL